MNLKTIIIIGLSLFTLGCIPQVYAVESTNSAANSAITKYKITFPITELGNCEDQEACKIYCSNVQNQTACIAYAKGKGFYKEHEMPGKASLLLRARAELGCDSENSCKSICESKENKEKCKAFAEKYKIVKEKIVESQAQLLTNAKQILGCSSLEECKKICSDPQNKNKCLEVFKMSLPKKLEAPINKIKSAIERAKEKFGTASAKPKPTATSTPSATPSATESSTSSAVQGVSTSQGIFSTILSFLNNLFQ